MARKNHIFSCIPEAPPILPKVRSTAGNESESQAERQEKNDFFLYVNLLAAEKCNYLCASADYVQAMHY
jgi:hypothetical protein